jgi:hypothetical protein
MMRVGARASIAPRAWRGAGFVLGFELGPAGEIASTGVEASLGDLAAHAGGEWRQPLRDTWWLVPAAGVSLHRVTLDGTVVDEMLAIDEADLGVAADVAVAVERDGRVRMGLVVTGSVFARRVRYQVRGEDIAALPTVSVGIALRLGM